MKPIVKVTLFSVLILVVIIIGMGIYLYNKKPADLQNSKVDYKISATLLATAFERDETAATVKYVNKVLEVNGIVVSSMANDQNVVTIALKTEKPLTFVICTFQDLGGLRQPGVGEEIVLRGVCSGTLIDVLMNNCVLVTE